MILSFANSREISRIIGYDFFYNNKGHLTEVSQTFEDGTTMTTDQVNLKEIHHIESIPVEKGEEVVGYKCCITKDGHYGCVQLIITGVF